MLVFGAQKTYLSKGPGHTPKMRYLNFFFPDCRFICTTRPPEQVIPSAISLFVRFCEVYHTPYHTGDLIERTIAMADYWYPHPLEVFKDMEENRQVVIQYRTMIHTISQSVSAIYKKLGLVVSKDFYVFLLNQEAQQYQSNHKYSAEKYGLNANEISIRYKSSYVGLLEKSVHGN